MPLLRSRWPAGCSLLLFAVLLAGCDSNDPEPPPRNRVVSFEVTFDPIAEDVSSDQSVASINYDAPEISPAVVEEGLVMAYMRAQQTWTALPYTYGVESSEVPAVDYTVTLGYAYDPGFLQVFYELSLSNEELLLSLADRCIKVVAFGPEAARSSSVNLSDYEAVRQHFDVERLRAKEQHAKEQRANE